MNKRKYKNRRKKEWEQVASLLTDNCCVYITPERIGVFYMNPHNCALKILFDSIQKYEYGWNLPPQTIGREIVIQGELKSNKDGVLCNVINRQHTNEYHGNIKKPPQTANPNPNYKPPIGHKEVEK